MVDWKAIPKIDAHIHLLPQDVIDANKGYSDRFVDYGDYDSYLNLMEKYNIEIAFIMPFNDTYMLSMNFKVDTVNNNLIDICAKSKNRLFCFADIDIRNDIKTTLNELERIIKKKEVLGVKIHPSNTGYPIDGIYYDEVFKWANDNNILVEIHSYPRENLIDDVCSPLRIKNIKKKYPNLRLSIAHIGGLQYEELLNLDLYVNISAILTDLVERYGIEKTNKILRKFDINKLIFASDYPDNRKIDPTEIYNKYFEILQQMDFTQDEAEKICKYNVLKMVGYLNK